jgi:methionyl aminopeptidase
MAFDDKVELMTHRNRQIVAPTHDMIKTPEQIDGIRKAGEINTLILDAVEAEIAEGITTGEIDRIVVEKTKEYGAQAAPLHYEGYPKSVCTSLNEVVCHGIPSDKRKLVSGDIVNVDCTTIVNGYYGDASRMYMIGEVSERKKKLVQVARECLEVGTKLAQPWNTFGDFGQAINQVATDNGFSVVREIGGHGVGLDFHEDPWVPHIGTKGTGCLIVPGMVFTIEPMINAGKPEVFCDEEDGWTIYTEDNEPSAQWEYTLLITKDGNEIISR